MPGAGSGKAGRAGGDHRGRKNDQVADDGVYIASAAKISGVSSSTIRMWEREGLVTPGRTSRGYRIFSSDDLWRLSEVRRLRAEGLPASEIRRRLSSEALPPGGQIGGTENGGTGGSNGGDAPWIGRRLRRARLEQGLSLRKLAAASGLAASYLSAVERGVSNPSIAALQKVAEALGSNIPSLLGYQPSGTELVRGNERKVLDMEVPGVVFEHLAEVETSFEPMLVTVEPGSGAHESYSHYGEEFIYVLVGGLYVVLDETETFEMLPGDSLTFESHRPHRWWATGTEQATLLWINSPPTF